MNRAQRRQSERESAKDRRKRWPSGYVDTAGAIQDGERMTIQGVRRLKSGRIVTNCKPGDETVFVARNLVASSV